MKKRKYGNFLSAPEGLDKHWAFHGARLVRKVTYRGQDVFLGAGGPHYDAKGLKLEKGDEWMRDGYYLSVFAIQRGTPFFGFPMYFRLDHDLHLPLSQREESRVNAALAVAKTIIDDGMDRVRPPVFVDRTHGLILPPGVMH